MKPVVVIRLPEGSKMLTLENVCKLHWITK